MEAGQDQLTCDGFSAWIIVDGVKTPQYGTERREGEHVEASCWISSEKDKAFSVGFFRNQEDQYSYSVKIMLDGHTVSYQLLKNVGDPPRATLPHVISSMRTSITEVRSFVFGSLELTDDDAYAEESSANIGEISLIIKRIKSAIPKSNKPVVIYQAPTTGKVHERSKKGLAHQIKLGSATKRRTSSTNRYYECHTHGKPIKFVFKYRPIAMLQATGIVPRLQPAPDPEPQPSLLPTSSNAKTGKREIAALKTEESELEVNDEDDRARERELLAELERIRSRQRAKEGNAHPIGKIKTEPKTYFTPGEVIDLT